MTGTATEKPEQPQIDARAFFSGGVTSTDEVGMAWRILDAFDYGVVVLTERADVVFANRAAWRAIASTHLLEVSEGRLQAADPSDRTRLNHCVQQAVGHRRSMVMLASERECVAVASMPLEDFIGRSRRYPRGALIVLSRQRACQPITLEFFGSQHQATPAELSVLSELCDGLRPSQIAARANVAVSTVRTQISSLRQKTRTSSVAELVRLAMLLPPIVSIVQ